MSNTTTTDGGPAFPVSTDFSRVNAGMTLRDYFAAAALQGALANPSLTDSKQARWIADYAIDCADAMLAARQKGAQ